MQEWRRTTCQCRRGGGQPTNAGEEKNPLSQRVGASAIPTGGPAGGQCWRWSSGCRCGQCHRLSGGCRGWSVPHRPAEGTVGACLPPPPQNENPPSATDGILCTVELCQKSNHLLIFMVRLTTKPPDWHDLPVCTYKAFSHLHESQRQL